MNQNRFSQTLHFVYNPKSGRGRGEDISLMAKEMAQKKGWKFQAHPIDDVADFERIMKKAADSAFADHGTLAAAGGDGTLRAAAQAIAGRPIRFAAIPGGTFNLFARTHHIPEDDQQALELIFEGQEKPIRVGEINGQIFLINANMGLYAKAIHERKVQTKRWGRHRLVAILSTVASLLKGHPNMKAHVKMPDEVRHLKTPMIFIGNNALQLKNLQLQAAEGMKDDLLAVFMMKPFKTWDMVRILFRGLSKTLDKDPALESFNIDSMEIDLHKKHSLVSLDGEMLKLAPPFQVRALPEHLLLVKSAPTSITGP